MAQPRQVKQLEMEIYYTTTSDGNIYEWIRTISPPRMWNSDHRVDLFIEMIIREVRGKLSEKESVTLAAEVNTFSGHKFEGPCLRRLFIDDKVFYRLF